MHDYLSRQQDQYNDNDSDATQMPDLTEYSHPPNTPTRTSHANVTPIKPLRLRTFTRHGLGNENAFPQTLDHMLLSPPNANPPITVLLVLSPWPANLAETTAFEAFGSRFCSDFGGSNGHDWSCISLYAHFRKWATAQKFNAPNSLGGREEIDANDVGIGGIHPYALRAKLDQEKEVQWRLTVPVLQALIDSEVKKGSRAFVVCGLAVGDVEGVRAFGRTVSSHMIYLLIVANFARPTPSSQSTPFTDCYESKYLDRRTSRHPSFLAHDCSCSARHAHCPTRVSQQNCIGKPASFHVSRNTFGFSSALTTCTSLDPLRASLAPLRHSPRRPVRQAALAKQSYV